MLVISFDSWEDYDKAIANIASAYLPESEDECVRCGEWVLPSEHSEIGCDI